jgi:hypothetical protein
MKIRFAKKFRDNPLTLLRRCGYKPWYDPKRGKEACIRRVSGAAFYPRFHVFYEFDQNHNLVLDLHLDARRPIHKKGISTSEGGESEVVRVEAERIKNILSGMPAEMPAEI